MIGLGPVYLLVGLFLGAVALRNALDATNPRRLTSATFWGLLSAAFLGGDRVPKVVIGGLVLLLALLAGGVRGGAAPGPDPEARRESAARLGSRLLWPSLLIPLLTVLGTFGLKTLSWKGRALVDPAQATLLALALACVAALALALVLTRERLPVALEEGRRLLDAIGWAALLPLLLATLGAVFTASGVGQALAQVIQRGLPMDLRFVALLAYALGMTLLTMIMGNAFAAFPVMMGGLGIPVLVLIHRANPAALAALGMLSGYCGTLLTPMAANFNLVPAALLELEDPHGVIKAQAPTALVLWVLNLGLMWVLVFR
jgi:uncharacterized membrane protein